MSHQSVFDKDELLVVCRTDFLILTFDFCLANNL